MIAVWFRILVFGVLVIWCLDWYLDTIRQKFWWNNRSGGNFVVCGGFSGVWVVCRFGFDFACGFGVWCCVALKFDVRVVVCCVSAPSWVCVWVVIRQKLWWGVICGGFPLSGWVWLWWFWYFGFVLCLHRAAFVFWFAFSICCWCFGGLVFGSGVLLVGWFMLVLAGF